MTADVGAIGFAPTVRIAPIERSKYESMWQRPEYRQVSPGEHIAPNFLEIARPKPGSTVIDFGAGTGRGALMMALLGNVRVEMLDFAENCLDDDVRAALTTQAHALAFRQHDLNDPVPIAAEYGYCTDVLEHIPPEQVDRVLQNILRAAQHVFFQISCEPDKLGALIGEPLHLTVQPYAWWLKKLQSFDCAVHWSQDAGTHCLFYVTAWQQGGELVKHGVLNHAEEKCLANVQHNISQGWQQVTPHLTNDLDAMILCGGPSLNEQLPMIRALRENGVKLITVNGAYNWALEHGLTPSAQIIVDARPFNARFTKPVSEQTKYLICSQCDPAVLEGLPRDRTYLWHTSAEAFRPALEAQYETYYGVPGGSTVLLRALPLMRMLGYKRFHLFGADSCVTDQHHAYAQPENDTPHVFDVIVGGRTFKCHPWMATQAQEFVDLIKVFGDEIELEVHGDGLLRHILIHGADVAESTQFLTEN